MQRFNNWAKVANFPISEKFPTFAKTRYPQAYHEGESGKSHTDRDRHADAGLAGCSPSPPPSRIQHLLRDVAGMRPMRPIRRTHAVRTSTTAIRFSSCRAGTISRISNRFRLSLPTLSQLPSSVHSPVRKIRACDFLIRLSRSPSSRMATGIRSRYGSSRFPGLTRLFPFQENGLFIRR